MPHFSPGTGFGVVRAWFGHGSGKVVRAWFGQWVVRAWFGHGSGKGARFGHGSGMVWAKVVRAWFGQGGFGFRFVLRNGIGMQVEGQLAFYHFFSDLGVFHPKLLQTYNSSAKPTNL